MQQRTYVVYTVASRTRVLYTGFTGDLRQRLWEHRGKTHAGFASKYRCDRLVWFERHSEPLRAIAREKEIKGWTRAKKLALVQALNETWIDLAEDLFGWDEAGPSLRSG